MAFTHTSGPSPSWLPHTSACQRPVSHRTLQPRRPTVVAGVWNHDKVQTQVLPQLALRSVRPDIVSVEQLRVDRSKVVSAGTSDIARARKRLPRKTCMPTGYKWSLGEDTNASARKGLIHKNLYADRLEMSCVETPWTDGQGEAYVGATLCRHCFSLLPVRMAATPLQCSEGHLRQLPVKMCHEEKAEVV